MMKYLFISVLVICSFNLSAQTIQSVADTSQNGKQITIRICSPSRYNHQGGPHIVLMYHNKIIAEIDSTDLHGLPPQDIKTIRILKGENAIKKYGEKAKNGVIEVDVKYRRDKKLFE